MTMLCSQCGAPAERCSRCASALCARRLCTELHEASCAAVSCLPAEPIAAPTLAVVYKPRPRVRRARDVDAERLMAEDLVRRITTHRQTGRTALLVGDLDNAFDELWAASTLEPDFDRLGAVARECMPREWELETDLVPLARALANRRHARAGDAWRRVLDHRPARSIQAEGAEWLAREAAAAGDQRGALRLLHIGSLLGRTTDTAAFHAAYKQAGVEPTGAFALYLAATRVDAHTARAVGLKDPLTGSPWTAQTARWWAAPDEAAGEPRDHQVDALQRARDLALSRREHGWLRLAEGDHLAGPVGVRTLGRNVRAGCAEAAEEDIFVRIRVAYEGAAERLPDVAWPWYRLAELLAWAGFADRAEAHLAEAERRRLGDRDAERAQRSHLRTLVHAGLGSGLTGVATTTRPFPAEPFAARLGWRFRFW